MSLYKRSDKWHKFNDVCEYIWISSRFFRFFPPPNNMQGGFLGFNLVYSNGLVFYREGVPRVGSGPTMTDPDEQMNKFQGDDMKMFLSFSRECEFET